MTDNSQKTPLARSLNQVAQRRALDLIKLYGKSLPASVIAVAGSIVTVKFELNVTFPLMPVTCPMFGPEYIRYPTQLGDKGVVFPVDTYIGGMSGLGGGVADLTLPANLSALVWFPIANVNWSPTDDPNAVVIYGPDGVIIRNTSKSNTVQVGPSSIVLTDSNGNTITMNSVGITLKNSSNDSIVVGASGVKFTVGGVTVGGTSHTHPDPQGGNTGAPNAGT